MPNLQNKTAVITGAAAGLGRHLARRFAHEGAHVIVGDRRPSDETVARIERDGGRAEQLTVDVADEASVRAFASNVRALHDRGIDILVNNAGLNGDPHLVAERPLADWERTLRVNLTGTMLVTRELLPALTAGDGGCVLNVASNVAKRGLPYRADYVASKWGLLGLTQTLALELAPQNVRVNAVCPGPIDGDRVEQLLQAHADAEGRPLEEMRRDWAEAAPMKRFITPEEVASVAVFLCGPGSSAMTGQALNVTGGFIMS